MTSYNITRDNTARHTRDPIIECLMTPQKLYNRRGLGAQIPHVTGGYV